ncbi:MAG: hypothetical protein K0S56_1690 [Microvirga sp.]|jgi:hypothetical protein|nr:hypothetical protein [Microvirga sp.]
MMLAGLFPNSQTGCEPQKQTNKFARLNRNSVAFISGT